MESFCKAIARYVIIGYSWGDVLAELVVDLDFSGTRHASVRVEGLKSISKHLLRLKDNGWVH